MGARATAIQQNKKDEERAARNKSLNDETEYSAQTKKRCEW